MGWPGLKWDSSALLELLGRARKAQEKSLLKLILSALKSSLEFSGFLYPFRGARFVVLPVQLALPPIWKGARIHPGRGCAGKAEEGVPSNEFHSYI